VRAGVPQLDDLLDLRLQIALLARSLQLAVPISSSVRAGIRTQSGRLRSS
jgi:hypothetical protein